MWQSDINGREVVCSNEFDFVTHRLCLLFRFDEDVSTRWTPFGTLRMEGYSQRFEIPTCALANARRKKGETYLTCNDPAQLFPHLCSRLATLCTSLNLRIYSTSTSPPPPPNDPTEAISTRLLYSGISSLFAVRSRWALPDTLRESGLYLPTPGISRANAAEAAAVIEVE